MLSLKEVDSDQRGIKETPTHCLATYVIQRGSLRQKRELAEILSDAAVVPITSIGIRLFMFYHLDILVFSIETVLKSQNVYNSTSDRKLYIQPSISHKTDIMNKSNYLFQLRESTFVKAYFT